MTALLLCLAAASLICPAWSPAEAKPPAPSRVVAIIPGDFPPAYFRDKKTGNPAGFIVDVLNAVAHRAGLEVTYTFGRGWTDIMHRALNGEADLIPGLSISEDRKKNFAFTAPIETFPISIFTRSQNYQISGISAGMTVAVIEGSVAYEKVKHYPGIRISAYKSFQEALFDLLAGQADVFVCPAPTLFQMARDAGVDSQIKTVGSPVAEVKRGIALRKNDIALLELLDPVINAFVGSPEYQAIYTKWYGKPRPFWTPGRIAAAAAGFILFTILAMGFWRYRSVLRLNEQLHETAAERKRAEEFIRRIFEGMGEGLIVLDRDYRILSTNTAFNRLAGKSAADITGKRCHEILLGSSTPCFLSDPECPGRFTFETGQSHVSLRTYYNQAGMPLSLEAKTYPLRDEAGTVASVIVLYHDITEKVRLEEQLRHAQKMEAVGQLAGGIAHDFNNILTAIIGYSTILQMKLRQTDPANTEVDNILQAAERAASLTQSLLAFSRKQAINPRPVHLNDIIRRVETLLSRVIGEDVELVTNLARGDLSVLADSAQVEQVLMNIATNARDAMPQGGRLFIETKRAALSADFIKSRGYGEPGDYALIAVTDTGCGMEAQTLARIFEPFFTTKDVGKGTGLGLSIAYGIIKQHGGYLEGTSEPGKGTTFSIYLPLTGSGLQEEAREQAEAPPRGSETILLAEDDADIRKLTKGVLQEFGYTVIAAEDGVDAVEQFQKNRDRIDLLILDIIMPRKNGREVYQEIKKVRPDAKVLFSSGYPADLIQRNELMRQGLHFIAKPSTPQRLLRKIREVLDS